MSKKLIFSLLFFLFAFITQAQIEDKNFIWSNCFETDKTNYVFATVANIRQEAYEDAPIVAKLVIGTRVKIIDVVNGTTIKGITTAWYQIEFGRQKKQGYILGTMLCTAWLKNTEGELFLLGHSYATSKIGLVMQLRAVKENQLVSYQDFIPLETIPQTYRKVEFEDAPSYSQKHDPSFEVQLTNNQGLENVKNLIVIRCKFPYCTQNNQDFIFFWTGIDLLQIISCMQGGDPAGYRSTEVIFPSDKKVGKNNEITLVETDNVPVSEEDFGHYKVVKSKTTVYYWNGKTLIKK